MKNEILDGKHGKRKQRKALFALCKRRTLYDIWHDGDQYIVEDTGFRCKSIHDLCWYCEVYEVDEERDDE